MSAIVESFTLLAIALFTIGVRTWYRWSQIGFTGLQLDDYIMPVCGLLFAAITTLAYLVGAKFGGLTNSYMTDEQRAALDLQSTEAYNREMGSKIQVVGWSLYTMELWVLKLCVAIFYSRLTTRLSNLNTRVLVAYGVIGVSYLAVGLSIVLGCQPMSRNWQIYPDPGELCQPTVSKLNVYMVYIPNVITDLYLLSIPLPLLWRVNISIRRKVTLMFLFSGAIFVMTAATIRAVVIVMAGPDGALLSSQWACREAFVSIVMTNLPIIQPLLRRLASKTGLSVLFSRSGGQSGRNGGGGSGRSYPLSSNPQDGGQYSRSNVGRAKFGATLSRHAASGGVVSSASTRVADTNTTAGWGSNEHILLDEDNKHVGAVVMGDKNIVVDREITVTTERVGQPAEVRSESAERKDPSRKGQLGRPRPGEP